MGAAMKHIASNFGKLKKFEGVDFKRWQKKMHFLLSSMRVVYVLTTPMPEDVDDNPTMDQVRRRVKWDNDDYVCRGLILNAFMSTSKVNDLILWHARVGHVHFKRMQDMSKNGLIPAFDMDTEKCKTCMLTKITKKPFQNVKRETKFLELIHSDLCDLHATPSLGNKKSESRVLRAVVRLFGPKLKTLGERGIECIFVGYAEHSKDFRFYVIEPNDSVSINSIIESNDAIFNGNRFSSVPRPSLRSLKDGTEGSGSLVVPEKDDPKTFDEAMTSHDVAFWKEAINDEMDSIMGNNTWVLTDLPPGCRPLGCKWIFKRKLKVDGTVEKFKARLVIHGFKQKSGIDYFDTYALVARISNIRLLIAMASIHSLIIHQMDVKTAFLNEELEEEVYMNQPLGFILPGNENKEFLSSRFSMKDTGEAMLSLVLESNMRVMLIPNKGQAISQLEYSRVIGCLMPDIAFVMGKLSRYTSNPGTQHWQAIQRASKKQTCITGSTMESEFVALAAAGKKPEWLKNLLLEIPLWVKPMAPISIRCDSAATLEKSYNQMYNGKYKHLGVRHSMIRELITNGVISIEFVRSQQNLADHLTKGLARDLVIKSVEWMRLKSKEVAEC
nr:zinc finger, CCHC-type [Tanacetum cinerariifolium]